MFLTSEGTSPMILSSSIPTFFGVGVAHAAATVVAAAFAVMRASDSLLISSSSSSNFLAAAALSSSAFWHMILNICLFCSGVMLDGTCRVEDKSVVEEDACSWFLWDNMLGGGESVEKLGGFVGGAKKRGASLLAAGAAEEEEEGEAKAAAAPMNNEAKREGRQKVCNKEDNERERK